MAQQAPLILGVAAAVGGSFIGIPPTIGFALGSVAGSVIFPPKGPHTNGPKLSDTSSQISSYGAGIARVYGGCALAGNLIWTTPLIPTTYDVTADGGKGGGGGATQTNTSYTCSFALALAELFDGGEYGLSRIWVQGKCYYDVREGASIDALQSSAAFAKYFKFYSGSSTQLPDPTMEAILGVGNVPAYLDQAYIVFTDFPLAAFGNAPPGGLQMTFEVVHRPTITAGARVVAGPTTGFGPPAGPGTQARIYPVTANSVRVVGPSPLAGVNVFGLDGTFLFTDVPTDTELVYTDLANSAVDGTIPAGLLVNGFGVRASFAIAYRLFTDSACLLYAKSPAEGPFSAKGLFGSTDWFRGVAVCADQQHMIVEYMHGTSSAPDTSTIYYKICRWNPGDLVWTSESDGKILAGPYDLGNGSTSTPGYGSEYSMLESDLQHLWRCSPTLAQFFSLDANGDFVLDSTAGYGPGGFVYGAMYADEGLCYVLGNDTFAVVSRRPGVGSAGETLSEIVLAECELAGLEASQVDVSALAGITVDGIKISSVGPVRTVIEALMPAYFFDMPESGGKLKAVLRGGASVATISQDELGAYSGSSGGSGTAVDSKRADPAAIVGSLIVNYMSAAADYQVVSAQDGREAVANTPAQSIDLPLVLSEDYAKQVAVVNLYNQVIGSTERSFSLPRKYAYVEPTDNLMLNLPEGQLVVRVTDVQQADGVLTIKALDEEPALYVPPAALGYSVDRGQTVAAPSPSFIALMNLPAQTSAQNDSGFFGAACGYPGMPWNGATMFESTDSDQSFKGVATIKDAGTMGPVTGTLGTYAGSLSVYDTTNTLTVNFLHGTPQSVTDADIAAGANKISVGLESGKWELLQFKTATLVSGTTFALTNLMRGVDSTDANIGTHTSGEKAVLMTSAVVRVAADEGSIDAPRNYRGVTSGAPVSSTTSTSFTNQGTALTPTSAAEITFDPTGLVNVTATNVQAAIAQLDAGPQILDVKQSVRAATTTSITLSGAQTIDGVSMVAGNRVLVKNQSTASQNGIYVAATGSWTRAPDANVSADVTSGMFTFVTEGTANGDTGWALTTNDPIVLGTTSLAFAQFTGAGGAGSVVSVSVATANGVSGSVATSTTTPVITLTLGAIAPSSVAASGALSGTTVTGTGLFLTPASATGGAGLRVPHGAAPTTPVNGDVWTTAAGLYARINGSTVGPYAVAGSFAGGTLSAALNEAPLVTLASASTVSIGAAAANTINISGTTAITAFDTIAAGAERKLIFAAALTLTYNGGSLILPGASNITTAAGDAAAFVSLGSGNWQCINYQRANGLAVVASGTGVGPAYDDVILADNPLRYYPLNELSGSVMIDSSGNATNGAYSGSPTLAQSSMLYAGTGKSVAFSGAQFGSFDAGLATFAANGLVILECVINISSTSMAGICLELRCNNTNFLYCGIGSSAGTAYSAAGNNFIMTQGGNADFKSSVPLGTGPLHMALAWHRGQSLLMGFVNGSLVLTASTTATTQTNANSGINSKTFGSAFEFAGKQQAVALFYYPEVANDATTPRALAQSIVRRHFQAYKRGI